MSKFTPCLQESQIFANEMTESKQIPKIPIIFKRTDPDRDDIRIIRRWNSHTPSLIGTWGGGYFLHWREHGTIIDPGCSFINLFRSQTRYGLNDINMVITTHDHMDHCQDFGTLITLFREYNKYLSSQKKPPKIHDLVMSYGVANQYTSFLVHPENAPFLRWVRVLPSAKAQEITHAQPLSQIIKETPICEMQSQLWETYLIECAKSCQKRIEEKYNYCLKVLPTNHRELFGENTGLGLRFELIGGKTIVISGDTGVNRNEEDIDSSELSKNYQGANLLILHVGTMEKYKQEEHGLEKEKEHLGLVGVTGILKKLADMDSKPELVVLTEWGYEFGRLGLHGRSFFTKLVESELCNKLCDAYFAAVSGAKPKDGQIPIIPADIGLCISLPDLKVWAKRDEKDEGNFVEAHRVRAEEQTESIFYRVLI